MPSKAEFVRMLQSKTIGLAPYDISQHLREYAGCVSVYEGDKDLKIEDYRGYMVRLSEPTPRTPENPELYLCVVSLQQSKQWQDLVWSKEILGVLDAPEHRTNDRYTLGAMIAHRKISYTPSPSAPPNVTADLNGLILALGCMLPEGYRRALRSEKFVDKYSVEVLQGMLGIPVEHVLPVLDEKFEEQFSTAVAGCEI